MTDEEAQEPVATTEEEVTTTSGDVPAAAVSEAPRSTVYEGGPINQAIDQSNVDTPPKKAKGCCHMHWHNDWKTWVLLIICVFTFGLVVGFAYWWASAETLEAGQSAALITPTQCQERQGVVFGGYCYTLNTTSTANRKGWNDAEQECRDGAGNLASILTTEENEEIGKLLGTHGPTNDPAWDSTVWIGMYKNNGIRESFWEFQWSDGSAKLTGPGWKSPYASWAADEPKATSSFNDCTYLKGGSAADPVWYSIGGASVPNECDNAKKYFVCKFPLASNPGRPQNVSASSGEGSIVLTWAHPVSTGGRPIEKYVIKVLPNITDEFPFLQATTEEYVITSSNNCTDDCTWEIDGLQPTAYYSASISSVNEVGSSAFQDAEPQWTRAGERVPDAPNVINVQDGNTQCAVKFDKYPPRYDGGDAVTEYIITATPTDGSAAVTLSQTGNDLNKEFYLVSGLSNAMTYQITVQARNSIGLSGSSNALSCMPSSDHPTTPTLTSITPGFREVFIDYDQAGQTYAVRAYAVPICEYYDGSGEDPCPEYPSPSASLSTSTGTLTITGLVTLQNYLFYIRSENQPTDEILYSSPAYLLGNELDSVAFTEPTNPGPVENVRLIGGKANGRDFTVAFDYPTDNGDSPLKFIMLDLYYLNYTANNDTNISLPVYEVVVLGITQEAVSDGSTGAFTIDGEALGLQSLSNYSVTITVENEWNLTSPGYVFEPIETGVSAPFPPSDVMAVAGARQAQVTWAPPADYGAGTTSNTIQILSYLVASNPLGMLQPNYTVTASAAGCDCAANPSTDTPQECAAANTRCTLTFDLGAGSEDIEYEFYVIATNDFSGSSSQNTQSAASPPSAVVAILPALPSPPRDVTVQPTAKGLTFSYEAPSDNGGRTVEHYILMLNGIAEPYRSVSNLKTIVVVDLDPRKSYSGTLKAVTSVGSSTDATVPSSAPNADKPSMPLDVRSTAGDGVATVSWSAPLDDGGADITSYTVTISGKSESAKVVDTQTNGQVTTTAKFTGLSNGNEYKFTVTATNSQGLTSDASTASAAVKPGAEYTTLEYVGGISAAIIVISLLGCMVYTVWWAWVEKELCWDDGDPNTRENARKRKEAEMAAKKAAEEGHAEAAEGGADVENDSLSDAVGVNIQSEEYKGPEANEASPTTEDAAEDAAEPTSEESA